MFSFLPMYSPRNNSRTNGSLIDGWAPKSKLSLVLMTGNCASLIRRSVARCSRSINSRSVNRNKYWG